MHHVSCLLFKEVLLLSLLMADLLQFSARDLPFNHGGFEKTGGQIEVEEG